MSDAALRQQVFQQGVVVENLKDKDGKPDGVSVTWADHHFHANPWKVVFWLLSAGVFGLMGTVFVGSTPIAQRTGATVFPFWIAAAFVVAAVWQFSQHFGQRSRDTLRRLVIRPSGVLETPFGIPHQANVTWLYANYLDVTGIQVSPAREWNQHGDRDASYIMLQTESGKPVFLGLTTRSKGEVQPIIVALDKAWRTMRPTVEAHMAMAAAEAAIKSGHTSFVVGDGSVKPAD